MLPDEISVEGGGQRSSSQNRNVTPVQRPVHTTGKMIGKSNLLVLDFGQYQPAVVPTPGTSRVSNDLPLGLVQTF